LAIGCEKLPEEARVPICGPFLFQHLAERHLDFRDNSLLLFAKKDLCFDDAFGAEGETRFYPPLSLKCREGPRGQCRVAETPTKSWEYEPLSEASYPYWSKLEAYGFKPEEVAYSSKQILWNRKSETECDVRLEIKGDLDGDGVFGRYTTHAVVGPGGTIGPLPDPGTRHPE